MNQKITLALLAVLITFGYSYGQSEFKSGFIITLDNDTIQGQISNRSDKENYQSCIFVSEGNRQEYFPDNILGFGYLNDKTFSSQIIKGSFVEVLVMGSISLFKSGEKYHVLKDSALFDLETIIEEYESEGRTRLRYNDQWRHTLDSLTSDCLANSTRRVAGLSLTDFSLSKYVAKYNKCGDDDFVDFKESKRTIVDFGVAVGVVSSEILITDQTGLFPYLKDSYQSIDPSVGVLISVTEPQFSERLSLQTEFHYLQANFESLARLEEAGVGYYETHFDLSTLSIPISIKYSSPKKRFGWYAQTGVNTDFHFQSEARLLTEQLIGNVVNTLAERPPFEIPDQQVGFFAGIGILKTFQKFDASIALKYFRFSRFNEAEDGFSNTNNSLSPDIAIFDRVSRNSRMVINLILFRK